MKDLIRKIIRRIVWFAFREQWNVYQAELDELKTRVEGYTNTIQYVTATLAEKSFLIDGLQNKADAHTNTIQYVTDTLMDHSYRIGVLEESANGLNIQIPGDSSQLAATFADVSNKINILLNEFDSQKVALKKIDIKLTERTIEKESEKPAVYQFVPSFRQGDAIGNHVAFIDEVLKKNGIPTQIYCEENLSKRKDIKLLDQMESTSKNDIILFHMASENYGVKLLDAFSAKKVMMYHNVTPDHFFHGFDNMAEISTRNGRRQAKELTKTVDICMTVSQYNKHELEEMGYDVPIHVVPIPFAKEEYTGAESDEVKARVCDGKKNIIFVGRVAPNKKFEDLIESYQYYRDNYNSNVRLILVGSFNKKDRYYQFLEKKIRPKDDIIFTGHISTEEWNTYYRNAHLFLCMSEHEGFCVPVIEAMSHQIPIIAYDSSAVGETLGNGGILLEDKAPEVVAEKINWLFNNESFVEKMKESQKERIKKFAPDIISGQLMNTIREIMESEV